MVNVASGQWYSAGQKRLDDSLTAVRYAGGRMYWGDAMPDALPPGAVPHKQVAYGFKTHAIEAARVAGHKSILWLDASMWAIKSIDPIFAHADKHGAAVWYCDGFMVGQWCADSALASLGLSREEAMSIRLITGGIVCLSMEHRAGRMILEQWLRYSEDGVSFLGPWDNAGQAASKDPRVLGHRHDMPALSVLVERAGVQPMVPPHWFSYWAETLDPSVLVVARGM